MSMKTFSTYDLLSYETSPDQYVSGEHSVKQALLQSGMQGVVRSIWMNCPDLETVCIRLARMFSHHYPGSADGATLLAESILAGANAYTESAKNGSRLEENEQAFLSALHRTAMSFQYKTAFAIWEDGRTQIWLPFGQPLIDWVKKVHPNRIGFYNAEEPPTEKQIKSGSMIMASYLLRYERSEEVYDLVTGYVL
ncbi:hypothetical protein TMEC54S_00118 [Thauera mechernichensis]